MKNFGIFFILLGEGRASSLDTLGIKQKSYFDWTML